MFKFQLKSGIYSGGMSKAYKNPVGPEPVRALYGILLDKGIREGWLITTSVFTRGAKNFVKDKNIKLIPLYDIIDKRF